MENTKVDIREKSNLRILSQFIALAGVLVILPWFIHVQWITGPIVNAILILILFLVGKREALLACFIPSLIALAAGLLPVVLAPMIPFIMLSNVLYVLIIDWLYYYWVEKNRGYWYGVLAGSLSKFAFLFLAFTIISHWVINKKLVLIIAQTMSWTQLATALTGGLIAWLILRWLKFIKYDREKIS